MTIMTVRIPQIIQVGQVLRDQRTGRQGKVVSARVNGYSKLERVMVPGMARPQGTLEQTVEIQEMVTAG